MTRIVLHALLETEDSLVPGEPVGEVVLEEAGSFVSAEDPGLEARLADLLGRPLEVRGPDPTGTTYATVLRLLTPEDPDYLPALLQRLERKDLRLHGVVLEP